MLAGHDDPECSRWRRAFVGRISSILRMDPSPSARYGPFGAYRYAIEARAGFFKERGISSGDEMVLLESR